MKRRTAAAFIRELSAAKTAEEKTKVERHYKGPIKGNRILGVRMGSIFELAKEYIDLDLDEIEKLLESAFYEIRMGGVSVMDFQAKRKSSDDKLKKSLYELYLRRHDRINNWDLVDRSAPSVLGGYLFNRSRKPLFALAKSANEWERRSAIVSTYYFIRQNEIGPTFEIAELLIEDPHEYVQRAIGSWLRETGKRNEKQLRAFLNEHASTMSKLAVRSAVEKLTDFQQKKYLKQCAT